MAVYDFLNNVMLNVDKRTPVCSIYCDMTQAFDYVNHNILLDKLDAYGIRGNVANLLETYLKNRDQYVEITKIDQKTKFELAYRSNRRKIKYGVPQGSVLGPLLFIIYINDLPKVTNHHMSLFADDSTVTIAADKLNLQNYENDISNTIQLIIKWLNNNNLRINIDKTKLMIFSQRSNVSVNIKYDENTVNQASTSTFLGLSIDQRLNWKSHTEKLAKRVSRSAYALYKLAPTVNNETTVIAYHGLVSAILRYGIIFWGNTSNKNLIFKQQKRCIRAMFGLQCIDSCKPYFIQHKILTTPSLYIFEVSSFVRTNPSLFPKPSDINTRSRRDNHSLCVRKSNTSLMHNSVFCMAPIIYNHLPCSIKELHVNPFKTRLKEFLVRKAYYSITEFLTEKLN